MTQLCLIAALAASLSVAASENIMVPEAPVSARLGRTATLPCWLNPPKDAEGLEVRWYRGDQFDAPVLFYRNRRLEDGSQLAGYAGRVSFGLQSAKSDGLKVGDVTLQLVNVTLEDAGEYTCYVSNIRSYDKASVNLNVTGLGTSPLLSVVCRQDDLVNVSCKSEGWYPKPSLWWSDQKQTLAPKSLVYNTDTIGLVSVHSWLLLPTSSMVSCSIGLNKEEYREGKVHLESLIILDCGSPMAGWVAFIVTLVAVGALAAVGGALYFRGHRSKLDPEKGSDHGDGHLSKLDPEKGSDHGDENEKLLPTDAASTLEDASTHYVNVTLDEPQNEYLKTVGGKIVREAGFSDGQKVTHLTSIKGKPGFSSGRHYWEVNLGNDHAGLKKSWWVGVASAAVKLEDSNVPPTPSNGFWLLSSDREDGFHVNTKPIVLLPVNSRPQTLGVYLNYEKGELSFYGVKEKRHIVTLATKFTGEVVPFFNPGNGDNAAMMILHREVEGQTIQPESSMDSSA